MGWELAQVNVARLLEPLESPRLADFVANLDRINALAEASEGFVWRLKEEGGNATSIRPFGPEHIVNVSVWRDVLSLSNFAYRSAHTEVLKRRREWFAKMDEAYQVVWWVPSGHHPDEMEAKARLELLRREGPTSDAFTFKKLFAPPGSTVAETLLADDCLA